MTAKTPPRIPGKKGKDSPDSARTPKTIRKTGSPTAEEEDRYQRLLDHLPIGVYRTTAAGKFIEANEALADMLGFESVSALKRVNAHDFYIKKTLRTQIFRNIKKSNVNFFEFELRRKDGRLIWVRNYIKPTLDAHGRILFDDGILVDITERKTAETELKRRIEFEDLVTRFSTRLITIPVEEIDDVLHQALEDIGRFARVDRGYIFKLNADMSRISRTHEWCAEGIPSQKHILQDLEVGALSLTMKSLQALDIIHIPRVSDISSGLEDEKNVFPLKETKSLIIIPLILGKTLMGFLGFDSVRQEKAWAEDVTALLKIVGEMFVNALIRKQSEETLRNRSTLVVHHQEALLGLTKLDFTSLDSALKRVAAIVCKTLSAERVGIWFFNENRSEIVCREVHQQGAHALREKEKLQSKNFPHYFQALEKSRILAIEDVLTDLRTSEFGQDYFLSPGISSLMDVPIRHQGRLAGIVCIEHTGPKRAWLLEEQQFAMSVGDLVSLGLETIDRKRSEQVKNSVFRVAEAALSSENLEDLFRSIHSIVSDLMPAKNFYISLYDRDKNILSFPYFVDEYDQAPAPKKPGKGLTEFVLRTGKPLLASPEVFKDLTRRKEVKAIGTPSIDWLGVPLKIEGQVIGILVVQSYTEGVRYREEDKNILKFFCGQAAMAIHRKQSERALKASLHEKEILLREIHHRVKNNMQVISSLLNLQAYNVSDPRIVDMFQESQRRIRTMALVHESLYNSSDLSHIEFSQYLRSLAIHLFHSYKIDSGRIHLNTNLENVFLNINTAIPLGLIANEFTSNSLKHAFPGDRKGEVSLSLRLTPGNRIRLRIKDDGIGLPEGFDFRRAESLGLQIIMTLIGQLEGQIIRHPGPGTDFEIIFREPHYNHDLRTKEW